MIIYYYYNIAFEKLQDILNIVDLENAHDFSTEISKLLKTLWNQQKVCLKAVSFTV